MINNIDKIMINKFYKDIMDKCEFPKFGSPETHCSKCMFYGVACQPLPEYVGCYHGWKREEAQY